MAKKKAVASNMHEFIKAQLQGPPMKAERMYELIVKGIRDAQKNGVDIPGTMDLANTMGISRRAAQLHIAKLRDEDRIISKRLTNGRVIHIPKTKEFLDE